MERVVGSAPALRSAGCGRLSLPIAPYDQIPRTCAGPLNRVGGIAIAPPTMLLRAILLVKPDRRTDRKAEILARRRRFDPHSRKTSFFARRAGRKPIGRTVFAFNSDPSEGKSTAQSWKDAAGCVHRRAARNL